MDNEQTRSVEELIEGLTRPAAYRHDVDEVRLLQTHISLLFFAGERVYKVKKPVDLGFLDYTELSRRRHFCDEEVRLNRRLAPDTYLGVVPITAAADGSLSVGGSGEALEWAVEMVRLSDDRMLSTLLERGAIDNAQMNALVSLLSEFHAACATGEGVDEHGLPAAVRANLEENLEHLERFVSGGESPRPVLSREQLEFLSERTDRRLEASSELLERRVREKRIREGHGDLHAGNICLAEDGIAIYDCIEFNRRFRCGDVAADLGFLAMDLDQRGYPGFSKYLVKHYADVTHDDDFAEVVELYKGYRALVRAKVAALTTSDSSLPATEHDELQREAMRYVQLALSYELPPVLILMCGLPACGKSWLAKRMARPLRATVLRSDVRRKVLARIDPRAPAPEAYESGLYSPERKRETYRSLLDDAIETIGAGHSVIVDATFSSRESRAPYVDAATRLGVPFCVVHVSAAESIIRERLERRSHDSRSVSDADLDVYLNARSTFEVPDELPPARVVEIVSGEGGPERPTSEVLDRLVRIDAESRDD